MSHSLADIANLTTLYSQSHRYYHNINHINWCLGELEEFAKATNLPKMDRKLLEYTIWWHDAVYNPYSKENERESADLFLGEVDPNKHEFGFQAHVAGMIIATGKHTQDQFAIDYLTQVMLDIDLAALGYPWKVYRENGINIRKEYDHVPTKQFLEGRAKFLRAMLDREHLYYTEYFALKYQDQAIANMSRDLGLTEAKLARL